MRSEKALRVVGARVALADYRLLQHDFPHLRNEHLMRHHKAVSDATAGKQRQNVVHTIIDNWLVQNCALVSEQQSVQTAVNSAIHTKAENVEVFRPSRYGRSFVAQLAPPAVEFGAALVDLKGAGVAADKVPSHEMHCDGLEYLGVALGDYVLRVLVDEIFRRTASNLYSVPIYAVLDMGFDVKEGWRGTAEAGLHVRRAHRRPAVEELLPAAGSEREYVQVFVELLLRRFGVTTTAEMSSLKVFGEPLRVLIGEEKLDSFSVNEERCARELLGILGKHAERIDRINVQLASDIDARAMSAQLYDFGHVNVRKFFPHPLASTVCDRTFCLGSILPPSSPHYVQPDSRIAINYDFWKRRLVNDRCFHLASEFRNDKIGSHELRATLLKPVRDLIAAWDRT